MKKLLIAITIVFAGFTANAQKGGFNLGANVGLPVGDLGKVTSFALSAEANYLFEVSDEFKVGPSLSYLYFFGKEADSPIKGKSLEQYVKETTGIDIDKLPSSTLKPLQDAYNKAKDLATAPNASIMPIALAGRFNASEQFTIGADLGYAIGLEKGSEGSFYYRPLVGYNFGSSMIQLAYSGFDGGGAVTLGLMFGF